MAFVIFHQFHFGIGSGETRQEAIEDARYILALGLLYKLQQGKNIVNPVSMEVAKANFDYDLHNDCDIDPATIEWVELDVDPDLVDEEEVPNEIRRD